MMMFRIYSFSPRTITALYALSTGVWIILIDWLIWNGSQISWNMPALISAMFTWKFQLWLISEIIFITVSSFLLYTVLVRLVRRTQEKALADAHISSTESRTHSMLEQFHAVLDSTEAVYVLLDRKANILFFNKQTESLIRARYGRDVRVGDSILWYGDPEAEHDFLENLEQAFAGERIMIERELNIGTQRVIAQVQYIPIHSSSARSQYSSVQTVEYTDDDITSVAIVWMDVTKLRSADIALRASTHELNNLRNAVYRSTRVSITDADGRIIFANEAFVAATQYSRDELYGKTHAMFRSGEHDDAYYQTMWTMIKGGIVWRGEICNKAKDGSLYWCDMVISPVFNDEGTIYQYLSIRTDITERKQLEQRLQELNTELEDRVAKRTEQLQSAKDRLETLNKEKDEIMGIVAHDLRNPLSSMMLMAEFIDMGLERNINVSVLHDKAQGIVALGERINKIIHHLLEDNRMETGLFTATLNNVEISGIIYDLIEEYHSAADRKHIRIIADIPIAPCIVLADSVLVRQVFDNLLSNALKYSSPHTTITLRVSQTATIVYVEVCDQGPGIKPEELPKIFKKFAHISNKPTAGEESVGLGLSAVKRMVDAMQGDVMCESVYGNGAVFTVSFRTYHDSATRID
jgi:PAS domain S-box-containing protein